MFPYLSDTLHCLCLSIQVLPRLQTKQGGSHGASILGAHLEGPFISKQKKGAHDEDTIADLKQVNTVLLI